MAEIGSSLVLGTVAAAILTLVSRLVRRREALMMVVFGIIFSTSGVAALLGVSPLLANMMLGFLVVNFRGRRDYFRVVEQVEEPIFGLFFGLGGAHIELAVMKSAGPVAVLIVITRMLGKYFGTWIGARLFRASENVRKYLGLGLSPQAGWTIGLVLVTKDLFPSPMIGGLLVNAVIGSIVISQLVCLPLVRYALLKTGEGFTARKH
jgi:Kef-type K+ transport system membrane component KefB